MNKTANRIVSIIIITSMLLAIGTRALATSENKGNMIVDSTYSSYDEICYLNARDFYEGNQVETERHNASIRIWDYNNQICLLLSSPAVAQNKEFTFCGNVFALHGNGYYDKKLVLGDFEQNETLNIVQFKLLNEDSPILTLIIEQIETGKLFEYSFNVTQRAFEHLMVIAESNTRILEDSLADNCEESPQMLSAQRILALMETSKRIKNSESSIRSQSHSTFKSTSSYSGYYATSLTLKNFCTAINNSTSSGITPSTTMQTVLSQTGWKMYKSPTYFYVMHGVANTSNEQFVGITVASVSDNHPETTKLSATYAIIGSCTVAYNKTSHIATLIMYDAGIRLEDATIAIELLGDTTNFYEAEKTWNVEENVSGLKDILVAISDELGIAAAIWDALQTTNDSSATINFGTDAHQVNVYGGLVRAVANQTKPGKYLWNYGHNLGIIAYHYNTNSKPYTSHRIAWGFTGYSLL